MTVVQAYRYLGSSGLGEAGLALQTSGGPAANPRFFTGFLTTPQAAAAGLLAVAEVARTRYFQPVRAASLDPVVTAGSDRLRFESFSGCCGVYARLDALPDGLDGEIVAHGTTNVDVNDPLRASLARISGLDPLRLSVGPDDLTVSTMDATIVEKKVPLPPRWLRGFAEVQVLSAGFEQRGVATADFLRRLPKGVLWAIPAGRGLRLTSRPVPGAICVPDGSRLAALRGMLRFARSLKVYGPPVTTGSGPLPSTWELDTGVLRLSLTLSPEPYRGFSGEGAALTALSGDEVVDDAELISALLSWDPAIDVAGLAASAGLTAERVLGALAQLGTAGRVGYDVHEGAYFHRVMPYDAGRAERDNPRLIGARALVSSGLVKLDEDGRAATVGDHRVRVAESSCSCPWYAKHRGQRGPCKHVLAVQLELRP
ncbi:SWIM zinc finger domain-containing protein [Winogradskya consettensis]|uniref:SWIM-type domain-containing protein n=1 Tax=Winogradskya consettensis TaxID=113560 RepID=A0A919VQ20_9ACTN|nr:SWIM zinc finger family protein [Actinoplanes consettensis]GIM71440.1 hypothetical protein Aco04nite_25210 [Actinoplanes consettensis]